MVRAGRRDSRVRLTLSDIDVDCGPLPYGGEAELAQAAVDAGVGVTGRIGAAECHLFPAAERISFAVAWLAARARAPA
jgi:hypothetical protein